MNIDEAINQANTLLKAMRNASERNLNSILFEAVTTRSDIKAIETLINEYNNLKQIEEAHRLENGKLREEITYSTKITPKQCKQLIEKGREEIKNKIKQKYLELVYEQNEGKNIVENRYKMEVLEEIGDVYEIQ